jgi:hypothetical protein
MMHCPRCQEITVCRGLAPSEFGEPSGQRWYNPEHQDIQWFRRGRECLKCGERFLTAEVAEWFLDELVELRSALGEIKLHAEEYAQQSKAASGSLAKLSKSLQVLQALRIYEEA